MAETLNTTLFANAMKDDYYKSEIIKQLNDNQPLVSLFTKDVEGFSSGGNSLIASIKTGRNFAVRSTGDGGLLPAPKSPVYRKLNIPKRYTYGGVQISGPAMKQSAKSSATFGNALRELTSDLVESIDKFRSRVLSGYGRGILALVNGAGSGTTTLTVDTPGGYAGSINGNRFLNAGMDIAIVDPATGTIASFRTITAINTAGTQVTLNAAVSAADAPNDYAVVMAATDGTDIESSLDLEPMGLFGMIDDASFVATYFSVLRSANPILNSTVIPTVGTLTAMKLQRGMDGVNRKSGKMVNVHLMDHSVRREYLGVREADFRYIDDKFAPDIGFDGGAMNGEIKYTKSKVLPIADFPYGYWMGVWKEALVRTVDSEGEWINEDGAILSRLPNRDIFIAQFRIFENFWNKMPNSGFRLDGVSATIDVDHIF